MRESEEKGGKERNGEEKKRKEGRNDGRIRERKSVVFLYAPFLQLLLLSFFLLRQTDVF